MIVGIGVDVMRAARLRVSAQMWCKAAADRFHIVDALGSTLCTRPFREPLYPSDETTVLGAAFVPDDMRCHRAGCLEAWPARIVLV